MPVTVCLDSIGQTGKFRVGEQLPPTFDVESGLAFGALQLDRQRHNPKVYSTVIGVANSRSSAFAVQRTQPV